MPITIYYQSAAPGSTRGTVLYNGTVTKLLRAALSPAASCAAAAAAMAAAWVNPGLFDTEALAGLICFFFFEILLFLQEFGFAMAVSSRNREVFKSVRHGTFFVYGLAALVLNSTLGSFWPLLLFLARVLPLWLAPGIDFDSLNDADEESADLRAVRYGLLPLLLWGVSFFLGFTMKDASWGLTEEVCKAVAGRLSYVFNWAQPESIPPLIIAAAVYYSLLALGHLFVLGEEGLFMTYLRSNGGLKHLK